MFIKYKNLIKYIINKLFNEEHNPLEAIGISIKDINERIEKINLDDAKSINNIKEDIDLALEFSGVISYEEKQGLERLKLQI